MSSGPFPITVVDAGVGNLGNVRRALERVGGRVTITDDAAALESSSCLLLPGVGAFGPPRDRLRGDLEEALRRAIARGAWLLGICVGYQLLFESSEESGGVDGLGLLSGQVKALPASVPRPHIGWNQLLDVAVHPLTAGLRDGGWCYYVHGFAPTQVPEEQVLARCLHGSRFAAIAGQGRIFGCQFHPEKSGTVGLRLLANYLEVAHGPVPSC